MAEIRFGREELANDLLKSRDVLGYKSEVSSLVDGSEEDDFVTTEGETSRGRTTTHIQHRQQKCIFPDVRKGPWSKEEDVILLAAFKKHGPNWTKVCNYLLGRTSSQCCERYRNTLDSDITFSRWTTDEDLKLLRLVKKYGEAKWTKIAKEMNGRVDNSICQRFRIIKSKKPDILDYVDPDVMPDASILPSIISRQENRRKALKRREEAYDALNSYIKSECQDEKAAETSQIRALDHILENAPSLLGVKQKIYGSHKRKKTQKDEEVDVALDSFLAPLLPLTGPLIKEKFVSMNEEEYIQAATAKLFLLKLFKCGGGTYEEIDIPEEDQKFFEETKEDVDKVFKHLIVGMHCKTTDLCVIPPNKATLNGFKIILSSQKQLTVCAEKFKDFSVIPVLTSEPVHSAHSKYLKCMKKLDFLVNSQETEDVENNQMLSNNTEEMSAEDTSSIELLPPPMKQRRHKYAELIEKYSKPVESIEVKLSAYVLPQGRCEDQERMKEFRKDFQLLKMRFLATFLWPAFLSTLVHPENKSENLSVQNETETIDKGKSPTKTKKVYQGRKRAQKKPWVTEALKKHHLELQHTLRETKSGQAPIKRRGKYNITSKNQLPTRRSTRHVSKAAIGAE